MARPTLAQIEHGSEGWDADINDNTRKLVEAPFPIASFPLVGDLPDPNDFDECIARAAGALYESTGGVWQVVTGGGGGGGALPGNIVYHSAETAPTGFFECDGAPLAESTYAALFASVGYRFTPAIEQATGFFRIPDLRGYFVRCWNHGGAGDPDAVSRLASQDGTTGDQVGTQQPSANLNHHHSIFGAQGNASHDESISFDDVAVKGIAGSWQNIAGAEFEDDVNGVQLIYDEGASDSRPININLMPIIKF